MSSIGFLKFLITNTLGITSRGVSSTTRHGRPSLAGLHRAQLKSNCMALFAHFGNDRARESRPRLSEKEYKYQIATTHTWRLHRPSYRVLSPTRRLFCKKIILTNKFIQLVYDDFVALGSLYQTRRRDGPVRGVLWTTRRTSFKIFTMYIRINMWTFY